MEIPYNAQQARELRAIGAKVYRNDDGGLVLALTKEDGDARGVPVDPELEMPLPDPSEIRKHAAARRDTAKREREAAKAAADRGKEVGEALDADADELEALAADADKPAKRQKPTKAPTPAASKRGAK